jgi:hypothetical protein
MAQRAGQMGSFSLQGRYVDSSGMPVGDSEFPVNSSAAGQHDQRFWPYNFQSFQDPRSQAIEPNKQQPVDAAEGRWDGVGLRSVKCLTQEAAGIRVRLALRA